MEKNNQQNHNQNNELDQDAIMIRVNETFDKYVQDVKTMIDKNTQQMNSQ